MLRVVLSTFPDPESAARITRTLVDESLAAGGNVISGMRSIYRWKGVIEDNEEALVIFETTAAAYPDFEARLRELHPYEVPEVIALAPIAVSASYEEWAKNCCARHP